MSLCLQVNIFNNVIISSVEEAQLCPNFVVREAFSTEIARVCSCVAETFRDPVKDVFCERGTRVRAAATAALLYWLLSLARARGSMSSRNSQQQCVTAKNTLFLSSLVLSFAECPRYPPRFLRVATTPTLNNRRTRR